jgi:hypothetical protein
MTRHINTGRGRDLELRCLGPMSPICGARTVKRSSHCLTRKYCFRRMYFSVDLSFSIDAQTVPEAKEDESLYRR